MRLLLVLSIAASLLAVPAFAQNVQRSEMSINVQWYGAVPNDGLDDTSAFMRSGRGPNRFGGGVQSSSSSPMLEDLQPCAAGARQ